MMDATITAAQWKADTRFDSTDWGWIIMSIGMAIGAGIVFLPVQVGLMGYGFSYCLALLAILPCICSNGCLSIP